MGAVDVNPDICIFEDGKSVGKDCLCPVSLTWTQGELSLILICSVMVRLLLSG